MPRIDYDGWEEAWEPAVIEAIPSLQEIEAQEIMVYEP